MIALLAGCQVMTLWGLATDDAGLQRRGVLAALWLVAALMSVIGGRVIPFFIQRGLNRPASACGHPLPTRVLLVSGLLAAVSFAVGLNDVPRLWLAALFVLMGALHLLRLWRWHDRGIWRVPLLWSLYLAYAWLVVAALAMALWHAGLDAATEPGHPCAGGGRHWRVDSGDDCPGQPRPYRAAVAAVESDGAGFALLLVAGVCRVLLVPFSGVGLGLSALLWCAAFGLFLLRYTGDFVQAQGLAPMSLELWRASRLAPATSP